jgi:predicted nuclease with TOPRIM domain
LQFSFSFKKKKKIEEEKRVAEEEKKKLLKEQKDLQNRYSSMKQNLFSDEEQTGAGIDSNKLVGDDSYMQ